MSNSRESRQTMERNPLILGEQSALALCRRHGFLQAAQVHVSKLLQHVNYSRREVDDLVDQQMRNFVRGLMQCLESAQHSAEEVRKLPSRVEQGKALRELRQRLKDVDMSLQRNWDLIAPLIAIEIATELEALLDIEVVKRLLPGQLEAEFGRSVQQNDNCDVVGIRRSYLLRAGSWPLRTLLRRSTAGLRKAEKQIVAGAPVKVPLEYALVMQLADFF